MLSLFDKIAPYVGLEIVSHPIGHSEIGMTWLLSWGQEEAEIDLPIWDQQQSMLLYRGSVYGLANIAQLDIPRTCERLDKQYTIAARQQGDPYTKILENLLPKPEDLIVEDYVFIRGIDYLRWSINEAFKIAFNPAYPPRPDWVLDRIMNLIKKDDKQDPEGTIFYRVDEQKPREALIIAKTIRFEDRPYIRTYLSKSGSTSLRRGKAFHNKLDFLASQGEESLYKAFLLPGVEINEGTLVGTCEQQQIPMSWQVPFGNSRDPIRAIIARSNMTEALECYSTERPIVDWNPNENNIMFAEGNPFDGMMSWTISPGTNLTTALVTWPGWLYGDMILCSRSAAERAIHLIPRNMHFWTGVDFQFTKSTPQDNTTMPPTGIVEPGQVLCVSDGITINVPQDLIANARVDLSTYRRQTVVYQDRTREVINFNLKEGQTETATRKHMASLPEASMLAANFCASRGIYGDWQIFDLLTGQLLEPGESLQGRRMLQCRPFKQAVRHSLTLFSACPLTTGCKITSRYGYKGIVRVIDDDFMPEGIDILIAQENVPNRGIALPMLGEMALGKKATSNNQTCYVGRNVTREQILDIAALEAEPETLVFHQPIISFEDNGVEKRGRLVMNLSEIGTDVLYEVLTEDGYNIRLHQSQFKRLPETYRKEVRGAVGPLYMMIMNRHPFSVAGVRRERETRGNRGLLLKGHGAVAVSINEALILRAQGMEKLAQHYMTFEPNALQQVRELFEVLMGNVYRQEDFDMTELDQIQAAFELDLPANAKEALAALIAGRSNTRKNQLLEMPGNTHWEWAKLTQWHVNPKFAQYEEKLKEQLPRILRDGSYDQGSWSVFQEVEDGNGGHFVTLRYTVDNEVYVQCTVLKKLKKFHTRKFV